MSAEERPEPAYLRGRYPDPALRACMARDADEIAVKAVALGNQSGADLWRSLARRFRDSLRSA